MGPPGTIIPVAANVINTVDDYEAEVDAIPGDGAAVWFTPNVTNVGAPSVKLKVPGGAQDIFRTIRHKDNSTSGISGMLIANRQILMRRQGNAFLADLDPNAYSQADGNFKVKKSVTVGAGLSAATLAHKFNPLDYAMRAPHFNDVQRQIAEWKGATREINPTRITNVAQPYVVSALDMPRGLWVSTGLLDFQAFSRGALGVEIDVETSCSVHCGAAGVWRGYPGTKRLDLGPGQYKVKRLGNSDLFLQRLDGGTVTPSAVAYPAYARSICCAGQSGNVEFFQGSGFFGLQEAFRTVGLAYSSFPILGAYGGTALLMIHDTPTQPITKVGHWWNHLDTTYSPEGSPGPCLIGTDGGGTLFTFNDWAEEKVAPNSWVFTQAMVGLINAINNRPAGQPLPIIIFAQGFSDVDSITSQAGIDAYNFAKPFVFQYIRDHVIGGANLIIIDEPIPSQDHLVYDQGTHTAIRESARRRTIGTMEVYTGPTNVHVDRPYGQVHDGFSGQKERGYNIGLQIANIVHNQTNYLGPSFGAAVDANGNGSRYDIPLTTQFAFDPEDFTPAAGVALIPIAGNMYGKQAVKFKSARWSAPGGLWTYQVEPETPTVGLRLAFPYGRCGEEKASGRIPRSRFLQVAQQFIPA